MVLPITVRDLIYSLCEIGWLYQRIQSYLQTILYNSNSNASNNNASNTSNSKGLISQAFAHAIQDELQDYYRLLAILEQEMNTNNNRKQKENQNNNNQSMKLTLLRLKAWMQEPLER